MARDIQIFRNLVIPGSTAAAPVTFAMTMPPRRVTAIEIMFPYGCRGMVGVAIGAGGTQVIPSNAGAFFTADGDTLKYPLEGYIDSGAWQMFAFNVGQFNHTIEVRFVCTLVQTGQDGGLNIISAAQLAG